MISNPLFKSLPCFYCRENYCVITILQIFYSCGYHNMVNICCFLFYNVYLNIGIFVNIYFIRMYPIVISNIAFIRIPYACVRVEYSSVWYNRLVNKLLEKYLKYRGNDLPTMRFSVICGAALSNSSFDYNGSHNPWA